MTDPTAGLGGAAPAHSALTLRLALAAFGFLVCVAGIWATIAIGAPWIIVVVLGVLAVVTLLDIAVVIRRRQQSARPGS